MSILVLCRNYPFCIAFAALTLRTASCRNPVNPPDTMPLPSDPIPTLGQAADIYSGSENSTPADPVVYNNALYFSADGGTGRELWKYSGSAASLVSDINIGGR